MIRFESLSKKYNDKVAIDNISLDVKPGEILGFLGPNGAGKTTTVKILTGMLRPDSGVALVAGYDVHREPVEVKKRIGYVPETGALFESLTSWEFLELVAELHHMDRQVAGRRIEELLNLFQIYHEKDHQLSGYSKGMKQKVLFCSAVLHNPEVLFLDEPLNGMDANTAMIIKELLRRLSQQNKTIMFCSHILEVVERICTRLAVVNEGKIIATGSTSEILQQTAQTNLEGAFSKLTGSADVGVFTDEFLLALEKV